MFKKLQFFFALSLIAQISFAQAPGDDCVSAVPLTIVPLSTYSTGYQILDTPTYADTYDNTVGCGNAGFPGFDDYDGVYSFVAPATGTYTFDFVNSGTTYKSVSVFSDCPFVTCVGGAGTNNQRDLATPLSLTLTGGTTYYVLIDSLGIAATLPPSSVTGELEPQYELLITSPIANDECSGAIGLTVNGDLNCGTTTFGTTVGATASPQVDDVDGNPNNDVWFSFVATNTSHTVSALNETLVFGSADIAIGVYDGTGGCGALIFEGTADDPETLNLTGLTIGNLYYVRVYGWANNAAHEANFDVCVGTPPPPPSNDECAGAIGLTVNPDLNCGITTPGTTQSATASPQVDDVSGTPNNDVWFSFTATNAAHRISLLNIVIINGSVFTADDLGIGVYDGSGGCGALAFEATSDPETFDVVGLTVGNLYYVRVYNWFNNQDQAEFDVCVGTPAPPNNDDCANAISLTSDAFCIPTVGTTEFATLSVPAACTGVADDDVWYSFVATQTEHTITVDPITLENAVFQVFEGSCAGTSLACVNASATAAAIETITLSTLTIGTTYYVRVYSNGGSPVRTGTFEICITEPCVIPAVSTSPPSCTLIADDTNNDPFALLPFDPDPEVTIDCDTGDVTLEAFNNFSETTDYRVERIPFSVDNSVGGTLSNIPISNDDIWSPSSVDIGFDFCFYGQTYNYVLIGSNGKVTFDINDPGNGLGGTNIPGTNSGWQFDEDLPSTNSSLIDYAIYGVYHDINPFGLTGNPIQTKLVGTGNCRKLIISWTDIPMFSDSSRLYTGRIELYESTNIIEVHIQEKLIENGNVFPWNDGNAIVGIQGNSSAGEALTAPCRGIDPNWEVLDTPTTREAWRFVPDGAPRVPSSVTWYTGSLGGTTVGTNNTLTVNTANTYFVEATYPTCSGVITVDDEIVVTDPRKVWDGSVDNNWYEDNNWTPAGIPDLNDCVVIPDNATTPNDPIADQLNAPPLPPTTPAMARSLTLQPGAYLEVATNTEVLVRERVNVQGNGIFNIESSGSLIQMDDTFTNSGTIHMQRSPNFDESAVGAEEYVYWSSPVAGALVSNISPASTQIFSWTPTVPGNGVGNHGEWASAGGVMSDATGYITRSLGGTPAVIPATAYAIPPNTALFSGTPNNGVITKQIFHGNYNGAPYFGVGTMTMATNEDDNWNFVGNPYPSAISANAFVDFNTNINGTVYVWPHTSGNSAVNTDPFYDDFEFNYDGNAYIEHNNMGSNPAGVNDLFISSGQGFFIFMNNGAVSGGNVTFNNAMRYDTALDDLLINYDNSNFYRLMDSERNENAIERHRIWLGLLSPNAVTNTILVGYADNATNEFDRLYDGYDFSSADGGFYSILDDVNLSIQGRAMPFLQEDRVPLGLVANETGSHTIAINTLDGLFSDETQGIYIEDTEMNITHDLREAPYTFTITEGMHNDRFILRYTDDTLSVDSFEADSVSIIAPNSEYIKVSSAIGMLDTIEVFDMIGKVIFSEQNLNTSEFVFNDTKLSDGAYIVKVKLTNGKIKIQKVLLK